MALRLGLCCLFAAAPVKFRRTTATALARLGRDEQLARLSSLCLENSMTLLAALEECQALGISAFRVMSPLFPLFTHPERGYQLGDLPDHVAIAGKLREVDAFRQSRGMRLSFHPDQFVVLSSPRPAVAASAAAELEYQGALASLAGADVVNLHLGGVHEGKPESVTRFRRAFAGLTEAVKTRLTLENDDRLYTPADLAPLCRELGIGLVYDVHHHRCNPDGLSVAAATELSLETWRALGREAYFHLSSPKHGWGAKPRPHADYIDFADFPEEWFRLGCAVTVDVEAKAKELAIARLRSDLAGRCQLL